MAIADLTPTKPSKGPTCAVCAALATLEPADAEAMRGHLANPEWRYTELSEALRDEGVDLPGFSLSNHARGRCAAREKLR